MICNFEVNELYSATEVNSAIDELDAKAETNEVLMCFKAYAVSSPGTVMVHSHYTFVAHATMMSSWRLYIIAFMANSIAHK